MVVLAPVFHSMRQVLLRRVPLVSSLCANCPVPQQAPRFGKATIRRDTVTLCSQARARMAEVDGGPVTTPGNATPGNPTPPYDFSLRTQDVDALGTRFKVVFADEGSATDPVVVCIHGAPATHKAFRHIVEGIVSHGYRVVIPNMPGMGLTPLDADGIYSHTTEHKAAIIRELLSAIGVKSIAMVVGHSMGGHVTCQLAADPALEGRVSSVCLLSSAGSRPHRLFSPYWLYYLLGQLVYYSVKLPLVGGAIKRLVSGAVAFAGLRGLTRDSEVFSWYEGSQLHFPQFAANVQRLAGLDLPALCIFSGNDSFIESPVLEDTAERLGVRAADRVRYDKAGATMETFREGARKRVVEFANGTHMVHYRFSGQVVSEMGAFLQSVWLDPVQ